MSSINLTADGNVRSPRKGKAPTFRVSTIDDFSSSSRNERIRRRSGLPSTACQTCRSRKVKCDIASDGLESHGDETRSGLLRCQACQLADIDCKWDTVDKRKRRRVRNGDDHRQPHQTHNAEVLERITAAEVEQVEPASDGPDVSSKNQQPLHRIDVSLDSSQRCLDVDPTATSNPDGTAIVTDQQESSHQDSSVSGLPALHPAVPSREVLALEGMDWSEVQDFVLDFEAMDSISNINWDSILEEGQLESTVETPITPSKSIRLRLYRRFGPTAVLPGMRKLSIAVNVRQQDHDVDSDKGSPHRMSTPNSRRIGSAKESTAMYQSALPDDSPYDLSMDALRRVTDVFFDRLAGHFPFINEPILHGHVRSGQCSSFLINSVVAVTLRFCPFEVFPGVIETVNESPWRNGAYFLKRAKEQLMSLLAIPTTDVVSGILILAWAEFGDNNEAGLWMLSGMAIRMAQDMGLHRTPEQENNPTVAFWDRSPLSPDGKGLLSDEMSKIHQAKSKLLLFWAVFALDVSVSLLTGRPPTLKRSEVDVPIPTAQDLKATQLDFTESVTMKNLIFPEVARFMIWFSEAVELLNQTWPEGHDGGGGSYESSKRARLSKVRDNVMNQYHSLSGELIFAIENYKRAAADKQSGLFLMLHVYFYAFTILLSQAEMRDGTINSSDDVYGGIKQPQAALLACQKIVQILNTAELIDDTGYLSTPFINQGLFIAASTILDEQHLKQARSIDGSNNFLSLVSSSDVDYLCRKLKEMSHYFKGVGGTLAAIERKKREMMLKISQDNHANEDEESDDEKNEVVQLSDGGIVNRYSIPEGRS